MANSNSTTHLNHQVGILFGEIATMANTIQRLMINAMQDLSEGDAGSSDTYISAAEKLAASVGFIADLGAAKLDCPISHGDAEDWFLPPLYRHLQNKADGKLGA